MLRVLDRLRFVRDHRWVPPRLSEYLDSELGPRERHRVERHTDGCAECRELLRSLGALIGALGTIRDREARLVGPAVLAAVQSRLSEISRESP
jgi:anti-sigma factor RsiW